MKTLFLTALLCLVSADIALARCWTVAGRHVRTVDGDTFDAVVDIWHGLMMVERIRVLDVDTPERKDFAAWEKAKEFTDKWLAVGEFEVETCSRDNFGRLLARVTRGATNLAGELKALKLGK